MKFLQVFSGTGSVGKSECDCDFVLEQSRGLILVKSECDFGNGGSVILAKSECDFL